LNKMCSFSMAVVLLKQGRTDTYLTHSSNFDFVIDDEDFFSIFPFFFFQEILTIHRPLPIIQHSTFTTFYQQSLNRQKVSIIFCNIHSTVLNLTTNELCDDSHITINYDVRGSSFFNKLIPHKYCLDDYANIKSCYWI
jgi:hypothetical protein